MTPAPHRASRNTALFALAALILVIVFALAFDTGQMPVAYAMGYLLPTAILAAAPLAYIAFALTRGPSRPALALGIAYPIVVLVGGWLSLSAKYASSTEGAMDVVFTFLFFWASRTLMVLLFLFLPAVIRLLIVSWRAYRGVPGRKAGPVLLWITGMTVLFMVAVVPIASVADEVPEYRIDVVDNAIEPMNECLWRVAGAGAENGFPDSLQAIRNVSYHALQNDGNKFPNRCIEVANQIGTYPFDIEYTPTGRDSTGRARGFTLRFVEQTRAGGRPRVVWIDESGLRGRAVKNVNGKLDSAQTLPSSSLSTFLVIQQLIDDYAASNGGEYPVRVVPDYQFRDSASPPPGVLALDVGECSSFEHPSASCVERWDRSMVYAPVLNPSGLRRAYTLTMLPESYYDNVEQQPVASRTHYRDPSGKLHSFGGWRAANEHDPPPLDVELASAKEHVQRFLADRARDAARAEAQRRQQDSIWGTKKRPSSTSR
jgi:hypothetical protein